MGKDKSFREDSPSKKSPIDEIDSPIALALILVCEKCGRKVSEKGDNFVFDLQKDLKHAAVQRFGKRQIRTLATSCFDICPKNRVAACVIPTGPNEHGHAHFMELKGDSVERATAALLDFAGGFQAKRD